MKVHFSSFFIFSSSLICALLRQVYASELLTTGENDHPLAYSQSTTSFTVDVIDFPTDYKYSIYGATFGSSVSLSSDGNIVAIGAPKFATKGSAFILKSSNDTARPWLLVSKPIISDPGSSKIIGNKISLSGNGSVIAVVLKGNKESPYTEEQTEVRIYGIDDTSYDFSQLGGSITSKCTVDPKDPDYDLKSNLPCAFGEKDLVFESSLSLSYDGTTVATASIKYIGYHLQGTVHVRVYNYKFGEWVQVGNDIDISLTYFYAYGPIDFCTLSLSQDGKTLAIGLPHKNDLSSWSFCSVYVMDGSEWVQLGEEIESADEDYLTYPVVSLSQDGKTVAVSGYDKRSTKAMVETRVYILSDIGTWDQIGDTIISVATMGQGFGTVKQYVTMDLSRDGKSLGLGFPRYANELGGDLIGRYSLFCLDETSQKWIEVIGKISEGRTHSGSDVSLSADGNKFAVGFNHETDLKSDGKVEVYDILLETFDSST